MLPYLHFSIVICHILKQDNTHGKNYVEITPIIRIEVLEDMALASRRLEARQ